MTPLNAFRARRNPDLAPQQKRMLSLLIFLLRLLVFSVPFYALLTLSSTYSLFLPLQLFVASHTSLILNSIGISASQAGTLLIASPGTPSEFRFVIDRDCTGWKSLVLLSALIMAVPSVKPDRRALGILAGAVIIWSVNLLRITSAVVVQQSLGREAAFFVHDVLWQFGLTATLLSVWLLWLRFSARKI